ncbi:conserved hypothetical protein [Thiomonas sp. X19]|uniref:Uncharacterized protein n=1 Tax=mine drainage metagenome TaxID=410659 RepID=E6PJT5_9ZZZZ|nr:hypothetical protein [Thiomonas sp. X19]SCC95870.1 conserved hypothetical protein [Thiomonas sp. X19]
MTPQHLTGIITLPTLLRITAAIGMGVGVVNAAIAVGLYWRELGPGQVLGLFLGAVLFNALALMFATLVGYWPYRALARRRRWSLHRISLRPLPP